MNRPLVCDASALTALLLDSGEVGSWVAHADLLDLDIAYWRVA